MDEKVLRVLVIDDQEELLVVLQSTLEADGHEVLTANKPAEGLALAEQQRPDVILLDINMPDMDGLQVLQVLRQSPDTARIPVILLTANRDADIMRRGFQGGADDYVQKPFNVVELRTRIRHQARLKQATDTVLYLQELNRLKEDFIAILSHELRTPLTAIMGFTELILCGTSGPLTAEQVEFLSIVLQRAGDLHHLIEELLEFNLIKAGQRWLRPVRFPLRKLLTEVCAELDVLLEQSGLTLEMCLPEEPDAVTVDPEVLRRVLNVLLSNAVKFTAPGGHIRLAADLTETQVLIRVTDTGIGIPSDSLPVIFNSFRQIEGHHTRRYGGLGLGLTIAKHLVELHRGRIWAESHEGEGSTFTVALPRRPDESVAAPRNGGYHSLLQNHR